LGGATPKLTLKTRLNSLKFAYARVNAAMEELLAVKVSQGKSRWFDGLTVGLVAFRRNGAALHSGVISLRTAWYRLRRENFLKIRSRRGRAIKNRKS
jgi:hypothetical protein